jgi:hypothetical protein
MASLPVHHNATPHCQPIGERLMDDIHTEALYAIHRISQDQAARQEAARHWYRMQSAGVVPAIPESEFDGKTKFNLLTTIYNGLYAELRDKDSRLQ